MASLRIGHGYDIHRTIAGRPLVLGGVTFDCDFGLDGHSDADALTHAICDALLGAAALPDIGHLFPNTDATWKNADSQLLLKKVIATLHEHGWQLVNIDATLIAERPKILPHVPLMKENLAQVLGLAVSQVGVKATTNERMGFPGREEGMCAMAIATVDLPI